MDLPILHNFCCKFSLKTGCITMSLLNTVLTTGLGVMLVKFASDIKEGKVEQLPGLSDSMAALVYVIEMLLIALLVFKFVLDLIFLLAVVRGARCVMTRFCVYWNIFLTLFSIGFLKTMFHLSSNLVIAQASYLGENFYFVILVRSYLMSIDEE